MICAGHHGLLASLPVRKARVQKQLLRHDSLPWNSGHNSSVGVKEVASACTCNSRDDISQTQPARGDKARGKAAIGMTTASAVVLDQPFQQQDLSGQ
eukprot:366130-Chlamydomonas_euryale.AAC.62